MVVREGEEPGGSPLGGRLPSQVDQDERPIRLKCGLHENKIVHIYMHADTQVRTQAHTGKQTDTHIHTHL